MESSDFDKSKVFVAIEVVDFSPKSIVVKNILSRVTGNVRIVSIDSGETIKEKVSSFDMLIHVIGGKAEVIIDNSISLLEGGSFIIIPAHSLNSIHATEKFKMITTVIKSGYEDVV